MQQKSYSLVVVGIGGVGSNTGIPDAKAKTSQHALEVRRPVFY